MFGVEYQNWVDLIPDSGNATEELSEAKKEQLLEEVRLRKEQEAKNRLIQQQKQQNKDKNKTVSPIKTQSQSMSDDQKEYQRTLSNTFELKFIVRFASFFMLIWLI